MGKHNTRGSVCGEVLFALLQGVHLGLGEAPRETLTRPTPLCCVCEFGGAEGGWVLSVITFRLILPSRGTYPTSASIPWHLP
ncbi:uncharacterized protein CLUP02_14742 [Colletotrichum lupini]|uniref:Uncharacterized protein n=1 Tax=Colletotrichum lupini TaxID=145971 RepID=A0A9Q8WMW2_9PEZI|nr:uncharacterized protein CLUP02_14742 [Colletotrichum lupini]UQC89214.1 hypothetical protein CLUP02_14742 [Colletotrichum lupini]